MSDNEIGRKIHQRRIALGLTLEDVGKAVGVGRSTVQRWESGMIKNMGADKIVALARVLGMKPVEFVPGTSQKIATPYIKLKRINTPFVNGAVKSAIKTTTNGRTRLHVNVVEKDEQFDSMLKLWKVSTPTAKEAAMKILEVYADVKKGGSKK